MKLENKLLFDQLKKKVVKHFTKKVKGLKRLLPAFTGPEWGEILVVYDVGNRILESATFSTEKAELLQGSFEINGTIHDDLYHVYGITTNDNSNFLVLIYDPEEVWSKEFILDILEINPIAFGQLPKIILYDFRSKR
jgi:hypothetical protein